MKVHEKVELNMVSRATCARVEIHKDDFELGASLNLLIWGNNFE